MFYKNSETALRRRLILVIAVILYSSLAQRWEESFRTSRLVLGAVLIYLLFFTLAAAYRAYRAEKDTRPRKEVSTYSVSSGSLLA